MGVLDEVLAANAEYAADFGARSELGLAPARQFAILTCMDARIDPAKYAGLSEGDAHVIRNAGGRATDDAIRSLVISHKLLGTNEWFVIHHTECGMESFTEEKMRSLLEESLGTDELEPDAYLDWLTIAQREHSVLDDVVRIRAHPVVPNAIPIYGYIFDVKTGRLVEVPEATAAGRPS
jgi:carbonic anhydrase